MMDYGIRGHNYSCDTSQNHLGQGNVKRASFLIIRLIMLAAPKEGVSGSSGHPKPLLLSAQIVNTLV